MNTNGLEQVMMQLKAQAYDQLATIEQAQANLKSINEKIQLVASQMSQAIPLEDLALREEKSAASSNANDEKPAAKDGKQSK